MKINIYDEWFSTLIPYMLDMNGDLEIYGDMRWQFSRPTPYCTTEFAHKLTCCKTYKGKNSRKTAYRRFIRMARKECPDLLKQAIEFAIEERKFDEEKQS